MAIWYVRPDTSHNVTRDGTTYATAWGGWTEIVAASMAQTDTLRVCGSHSYSSVIAAPKSGGSNTTRFILSGDYSSDPGSITFTGNGYFNHNQQHYIMDAISINAVASTSSYAEFLQAGRQNFTRSRSTVISGVNQINSGINIACTDTSAAVNLIFDQMTVSGGAQGLRWLQSGTISASITGLTITRSNISGTVTGVEFRYGGTAGTVAVNNMTITDSTFRGISGVGLRVVMAPLVTSASNWIIERNTTSNCGQGGNGAAGGMVLQGVTGLRLRQNYSEHNNGRYGGIDLLYCSNFLAEENHCNDNYSNDIDGNGLLIDDGCDIFTVRRNECSRNSCISVSSYTPGNPYGGCGIMILAAKTGKVYSNYGTNNKRGWHVGGSPHTDIQVWNNTFINSTENGCDVTAAAGTPNVLRWRNNILTCINPGSGWIGINNLSSVSMDMDYTVLNGFDTNYIGQTSGTHDLALTSDQMLSTNMRPKLNSPLLTSGVNLGPIRTADGKQSSSHIGAFGPATMRKVSTP